jgi:hypothetical protein
VFYPKAGNRPAPAVSLVYPISCPTPTPTTTTTPTVTPTNTNTPSITPSITPTNTTTPTETPTPTPTLTPTSSAVPAIPVLLNLDAAEPSSYPGSGNIWFDISGNGNDATLDNSPTFVSSGISSYFSFSGNTNYADISGFSITNNTSLVMMLNWYGGQTAYGRIWSTDFDKVEIGVNNTGDISVYVSNSWRNNVSSFDGVGVCAHLVFTFDGAEMKVYKNGTLVNTTNIGSAITPGLSNTTISDRWNKPINEYTIIDTKYFKVYDAVLDASQVLNEYNNNSLRC